MGLAGGEDDDFFQTKTARLGYFAYRPSPDYVGEDSFSYTVRSETAKLMAAISMTAVMGIVIFLFFGWLANRVTSSWRSDSASGR